MQLGPSWDTVGSKLEYSWVPSWDTVASQVGIELIQLVQNAVRAQQISAQRLSTRAKSISLVSNRNLY